MADLGRTEPLPTSVADPDPWNPHNFPGSGRIKNWLDPESGSN